MWDDPGGKGGLGGKFPLNQVRQVSDAVDNVGVPVFAPGAHWAGPAQDADDASHAGVASFEHVGGCVADLDHLMHALYIEFLHGIEQHEGRRAADLPGDVFNIHCQIYEAVPQPSQTIHDGLHDHPVEAGIGRDENVMRVAPAEHIRSTRDFFDMILIVLDHQFLIAVKYD